MAQPVGQAEELGFGVWFWAFPKVGAFPQRYLSFGTQFQTSFDSVRTPLGGGVRLGRSEMPPVRSVWTANRTADQLLQCGALQCSAMEIRKSPFLDLAAVSLLLAVLVMNAQSPARRPLTHRDYDSWHNIQNQQLSRDGKFLVYAVFPRRAMANW